MELPQDTRPVGEGVGVGGSLPYPVLVCTLGYLWHPQAHLVPHSSNDSEIPALTPSTVPSRLPRRGDHSSPFREELGVGSASPPPHRRGAAVPVAQMCGARGEALAGGFPAPATPDGPSSFMLLPSPVPAPSRAAALRSPPPASLPAVFGVGLGSWGTAARRGGRVGRDSGAPYNSRKQSPCPGGGAGGQGRTRPGGWSVPPPLLQCIWPGQLRAWQTPDQSPLRASKGTLAGGAAGKSLSSDAAESASVPGPSFSKQRPRALTSLLGSSRPCSHPPTHTLSLSPCPFLRHLHFLPSEGGENR